MIMGAPAGRLFCWAVAMGWTAVLWAALLLPPGWTGVEGGLGPIEVVEPRGGPRVVYRSLAAPSLVAVRLSVPVEERPGSRGAARLLQALARGTLEAGAAAIGARAELEWTPTHAVYTIMGPAESFAAMAALLRRVLSEPELSARGVAAVQARSEREALAELELPGARVRLGLRASLFPTPDAAGSPSTADRLRPEHLEWFWRRYYVPERMTAVVVGAVPLSEVVSAFRGWPAPPAPSAPPPPAEAVDPPPRPEAVATWAGIGWSVASRDPAVLAVASAIVTSRLAATGLTRARAELWWQLDRIGFVVIGSALPGAGAAPALTLRWALERAAEEVQADEVAAARRTLYHALVYDARTPWGLASLIGRFADRTGDPRAAERFLDALHGVDASRVRSALLAIVHASPAVVEVGP